jgi:hypothetical protein
MATQRTSDKLQRLLETLTTESGKVYNRKLHYVHLSRQLDRYGNPAQGSPAAYFLHEVGEGYVQDIWLGTTYAEGEAELLRQFVAEGNEEMDELNREKDLGGISAEEWETRYRAVSSRVHALSERWIRRRDKLRAKGDED